MGGKKAPNQSELTRLGDTHPGKKLTGNGSFTPISFMIFVIGSLHLYLQQHNEELKVFYKFSDLFPFFFFFLNISNQLLVFLFF